MLSAQVASEPACSLLCPPGVVWQLPGDDRPAGPQLCALPAEAGQCHQQLQHQPHLGRQATPPAGLTWGAATRPWLFQLATSSHLLLGALTPDGGGHQWGQGTRVAPSPPHLLIKVKHWPGHATGSWGLGGTLWTSAFPAVKRTFPAGSVAGHAELSVTGSMWGQLWADIALTAPTSQAKHIGPAGHWSFNSKRRTLLEGTI